MVVMGVVSSEVLGGGVGTFARSVIEADLKPPKDCKYISYRSGKPTLSHAAKEEERRIYLNTKPPV